MCEEDWEEEEEWLLELAEEEERELRREMRSLLRGLRELLREVDGAVAGVGVGDVARAADAAHDVCLRNEVHFIPAYTPTYAEAWNRWLNVFKEKLERRKFFEGELVKAYRLIPKGKGYDFPPRILVVLKTREGEKELGLIV
ncbi:hypothetical protein [Thermofilum pendens]